MPSRHRDRGEPALNADYYGMDPYDVPRDFGSQPPPRSRHYVEPLPPRGKSERRRPVSPDPYDDPYMKPKKPSSRRVHDKPPPPIVTNGGRRARAGSLSPPRAPAPSRYDRPSQRDRDLDRKSRPKRQSMPPPVVADPSPYPASLDPRTKSRKAPPPRGYYDDEPAPPRRSRRVSPPPEPKRGRDPPGGARRRPKDYPPPSHPDDRYGPPPRRHRSQTRDVSPRGRAPPSANRGPGPARRNSMPASTRRSGGGGGGGAGKRAAIGGAAAAAAKSGWWKNPIVQAGARQAFTAGAHAAIRSKDDKGPWLGPKGAKIATAALSAALVDGFLGQKKPDAPEREMLRTGGNAAIEEIDRRRKH